MMATDNTLSALLTSDDGDHAGGPRGGAWLCVHCHEAHRGNVSIISVTVTI